MFNRKAIDLNADLSESLFGNISGKPHEVIDNLKYGDPAALSAVASKHGFANLDDALSFLKQQDQMRTPFSQYQRTAGEVEARNVQSRMNMSPEERKAKPPWTTEDVPREQQIIRKPFGSFAP